MMRTTHNEISASRESLHVTLSKTRSIVDLHTQVWAHARLDRESTEAADQPAFPPNSALLAYMRRIRFCITRHAHTLAAAFFFQALHPSTIDCNFTPLLQTTVSDFETASTENTLQLAIGHQLYTHRGAVPIWSRGEKGTHECSWQNQGCSPLPKTGTLTHILV